MSSTKIVLPLFVVDAFTKKAFEGNAAAVCLLPFHEMISKDIKQKIAAEMKLSETAFITKKSQKDSFEESNSFKLEWFTPKCEVHLCGHATLASAAVLFMIFNNKSTVIEFETLSGILKVKQIGENKIEIDLPAYKSVTVAGKFDRVVKAIVRSLPVRDIVLSDSRNLLVRLSDEITREEFESIRIKGEELITATSDIIGVIITLRCLGRQDCRDEEGNHYDFLSRYFAPWLGVPEDPVTGSAHSVLAQYWADELGMNTFYARQCSERGGDLSMELLKGRVLISGDAAIVIQGQISF